MKDEYGTHEIQEYLTKLLSEFNDFCIRNNIEYSVWDGTLLGTIRHKGFIPWDDDLDVILDRENYRKLLELCNSKNTELHVSRRLWINRIGFSDNPYAETDAGVIDLFVFDNIPDRGYKRKFKVLILKCLQGMMKEKGSIHSGQYSIWYRPLVTMTYLLGLMFRDEVKFRWYDRVSQWGNNKSSKSKGVYNEPFSYIGKNSYPNIKDEYLILPFENIRVKGLAEYHSYLFLTYGDYMKLPPNEQRKPQHIRMGEC